MIGTIVVACLLAGLLLGVTLWLLGGRMAGAYLPSSYPHDPVEEEEEE